MGAGALGWDVLSWSLSEADLLAFVQRLGSQSRTCIRCPLGAKVVVLLC